MDSKLRFVILGAFICLLFAVSASGEAFQEWIKHYAGQPEHGNSYAKDIVIDDAGDVYVTGESACNGRLDMVTIKYRADGSEAWVARYLNESITRSHGVSVYIDADGYIYALGGARNTSDIWISILVKYSPEGQMIWETFVDPETPLDFQRYDSKMDSEGHVIIAGEVEYDLAAVKYNPDGSQAWYRRYDGPEGFQFHVTGTSLDASGNVYLGGYTFEGQSYIMKCGPDGEPIWEQTIGLEACRVELRHIRIDNAGNVFFLGETFTEENLDDWFVLKLNAAGEPLWTFSYRGVPVFESEKWDNIEDAAVDDAGNLFVAGVAGNGPRSLDFVTMKIGADGTMDWIQQLDGGANSYDQASDICLDQSGNIFVAGIVFAPYKDRGDFFVTRLDDNGAVEWARRYTGPTDYNNQAVRLRVTDEGVVYATGFTQSGTDASDSYTTIKYVPSEADLGDANTDSEVNVGDAVTLINRIFKGGEGPSPAEICDANCDSQINVGDIVYLIAMIFRDGPPCDCMH